MNNAVMRDIQRTVSECTVDMSSRDYAAFMQELAEWAQAQADMAEYADDYMDLDND